MERGSVPPMLSKSLVLAFLLSHRTRQDCVAQFVFEYHASVGILAGSLKTHFMLTDLSYGCIGHRCTECCLGMRSLLSPLYHRATYSGWSYPGLPLCFETAPYHVLIIVCLTLSKLSVLRRVVPELGFTIVRVLH